MQMKGDTVFDQYYVQAKDDGDLQNNNQRDFSESDLVINQQRYSMPANYHVNGI